MDVKMNPYGRNGKSQACEPHPALETLPTADTRQSHTLHKLPAWGPKQFQDPSMGWVEAPNLQCGLGSCIHFKSDDSDIRPGGR